MMEDDDMRGRGIALMAGASMGRRRGAEQAQMQMQQQQLEEQAKAAQQPQGATSQEAPRADLTGELQKLAQLHQSGALSDEEFSAAKQKLLSGV